MTRKLVERLLIKQDTGYYEPRYTKVVLAFWEDGRVTWEPAPETERAYVTDHLIGRKPE